MRSCFVILLVFAAFAAHTINAEDFFAGVIGPTDQLLDRKTIRVNFRLGRTVENIYTFTDPTLTIKGIKVIDNKKRKGATATITAGVLGTDKTITVKFTSQRGFGIDSTIEVWGS